MIYTPLLSNSIYITPQPIPHYQYPTTNTPLPIRHYQYATTNTQLPILHYQYSTTNTQLPILHYQYSTTNTQLPKLHLQYATTYFYNLYYFPTVTTYLLPTLLLLFTSLTRTFTLYIFSLHTIPYTCLPYTQSTLHTSLTCNSLSRDLLTHIITIITSIIYLFLKTYYLLY